MCCPTTARVPKKKVLCLSKNFRTQRSQKFPLALFCFCSGGIFYSESSRCATMVACDSSWESLVRRTACQHHVSFFTRVIRPSHLICSCDSCQEKKVLPICAAMKSRSLWTKSVIKSGCVVSKNSTRPRQCVIPCRYVSFFYTFVPVFVEHKNNP